MKGIVAPFSAEDFCDRCGSPMPWASRRALLWELENRIEDDPDLSDADRLTIREQFEALHEPDLDEEEQVRRWQRLKALVPGLLHTGRQILVSATVQKQLGL
jgi:hypothetical protein